MIQQLTANDIPALVTLMQAYTRIYPGVPVPPGLLYLSPSFHGGQDVFCAFDDEQHMIAYAPLYFQAVDGPNDLPHIAWVEVRADPDLPDPLPIKDALLARLLEHARALAQQTGSSRPVRMSFQYLPIETAAINYVCSHGFAYTESVFSMYRDLSQPVPDLPAPAGIEFRFWRMESEAEQRAYIAARNECFPEAPIVLEEWQYFMGSPLWEVGGTIAAFAGEELVGTVALFWNEAENQEAGVRAAYTEYIFVRPGWRGQGVALAMVAAGLRVLQSRGMEQARLEVRALNESALGLYTRLGYQVSGESRFYARMI